MFNLLPHIHKEFIRKEYSMRRMIVWLTLVFVVLLISLVLLMPSYLLSRVRAGEAADELAHTKSLLEGALMPAEVTKEIAVAIGHAQELRPFKEGNSAYDIIKIFEIKPATIKLTSVSYSLPADVPDFAPAQPKIILKGIAPSRDSLTSFGKLIENREEFASVEIPVSSFVKETNIDFSMTVTLK